MTKKKKKDLINSICSKLHTSLHLTNVIKKGLPLCSPKELQTLDEELDRYIEQLNKERRYRKAQTLDEAKRLLLEDHDKTYKK